MPPERETDRSVVSRPAPPSDTAADSHAQPCGAAPAASPLVSVVMANHNGSRTIAAALHSALKQSLRDIEIIVADDGSTDDSVACVAAIARDDRRVRLLRAPCKEGPGAARNRCLDAARGRWLAVLDSDDLMHPGRLASLIATAERDGADIIADDLLIFDDDPRIPPTTCLRHDAAGAPFWVDAAAYVRGNTLFRGGQSLGYLKPLFRAGFVQASSLRYDPTLRIAEDYDFILRLLRHGARFRVVPQLGYFYRKHAQSISHRLSRRTLEPMLAAHDRLQATFDPCDEPLNAAMTRRRASLLRALAFDDLVAALKQLRVGSVGRIAVRHPAAVAMLRRPVLDRIARFAARRHAVPDSPRRQVCVLSRQRVIGNTNGSSVYLLSLCAALHQASADLHLLCPSPAVFGRWPVMQLRPEMRLFRSITLRRSLRIGPLLFTTDPATIWRAAVGVIGKLGSRLGIAALARLDRLAPYAIGQPWARADFLFVARHAPARADVVVADYAFLTDGIACTLRPDARSLVVMHDLFSSRAAQFDRVRGSDSVADIDQAAEMALLHQADAVVAIQAEEAAVVRQCLPDQRVIIAPIAVTTVAAPQPGEPGVMLFVGSSTAPNVQGLRWFLEAILPRVRAAVPEADLWVAGTVCGKLDTAPQGVRLLGPVRDLAAVYRSAAVVVSPLQVGSGLKIKLIEALGHGKAVVATSVTMQGVGETLADAVAVADEPERFTAAVVELLRDTALREQRATAALALARRHFSASACHAELVAFVQGDENAARRPS